MKKFGVFFLHKHNVNTRRFIRLILFPEISRKLAEDTKNTQENLRVLVKRMLCILRYGI